MNKPFRLFIAITLVLAVQFCYAQQPVITYNTPQTYTAGTAISPLAPTNTGGPVGSPTPIVLGSGLDNVLSVALDAAGNTYAVNNGNNSVVMFPAGGGKAITIGFDFYMPSGVAVDSEGNVYVADFGNNAVKKIPATGGDIVTVGTGIFMPYGIAVDIAGNVFVTDRGSNTIKKITPDGNTTIFASGFNTPTGIAVDAAGNVYVTDRGNNAIKKITVEGTITTLASGNGNPNGVAVDGTGNVYFADTNNSSIIELPVAGGAAVNVGSGLQKPTGVAADADGNVYIADYGTSTIKEVRFGGYVITPALPAGLSFDLTTGIISGTPIGSSDSKTYTVTGFNASGSGTAKIIINIVGNGPHISYPSPLVFATGTDISPVTPVNTGTAVPSGGYAITPSLPAGLVFNSTTGAITGSPFVKHPATNYTVTATNINGQSFQVINIAVNAPQKPAISYPGTHTYTALFPASPATPANTGGKIPVTAASIIASGTGAIHGVAVDAAGNMYISDASQHVVRKIPAGGGVPVTIASGLNVPEGIVVDALGNVYVADSGDNVVKKIPSGGGQPVNLISFIDAPKYVAVDTAGYVYVANAAGTIRETRPDGSATWEIHTSGIVAISGLFAQKNGTLYLTDSGDNTVKQIPGDYYSYFLNYPHVINTVTLATGLNGPTGLVLDTAKNIYVSDGASGTIKRVPAGGGTPVAFASGIANPLAISLDGSGNSYVLNGAYQITVIRQGGYFVSPSLPTGLNFDNNTGVISGTPTVSSPATDYYVTAYNAGGSASTTVNIRVSDLTLASLSTSSGNLSPVFSSETLNYISAAASSTSSITINPTTNTVTDGIKINGVAVASGTASESFPLPAGSSVFKIVVTAQDGGPTKTYTITVTRPGSSNSSLSALGLSTGTLSPVFAAGTKTYTTTVPNATNTIIVTPTAGNTAATIKVNGTIVASGAASKAIPLAFGSNTISIAVTAQDGITTKTYVVTVTRTGSTNASLSALALSNATISPAFAVSTVAYTANVANAVTSTTVTPTAGNALATIKVNGVVVASGTASAAIPLVPGANVISTVVTAQDGTTVKTYKITVTRQASANADLTSMVLSTGTLSPAFATATTAYTVTVPNATNSLKITSISSDGGAVIKVNGVVTASGVESRMLPLTIGPNTITVAVTASDGVTTKTYSITATRTGSNNATLSALSLSSGTLTPAFAAGTLSYTASVTNATTSITLTPTAGNPAASIKVNGTTVATGTASGVIALAVGLNTISTVVTAQDGTTVKTYTVKVTRAASGLAAQYIPESESPQTTALVVHQNVSPNGDGKADVLVIDGITAYPDNTMQIMSRSGELVYQVKGYDNLNKAFDGQSNINGKMQQAGTYFYSLEYKDGGETKHKTGFIVLKY